MNSFNNFKNIQASYFFLQDPPAQTPDNKSHNLPTSKIEPIPLKKIPKNLDFHLSQNHLVRNQKRNSMGEKDFTVKDRKTSISSIINMIK